MPDIAEKPLQDAATPPMLADVHAAVASDPTIKGRVDVLVNQLVEGVRARVDDHHGLLRFCNHIMQELPKLQASINAPVNAPAPVIKP